MKKILPIFLLFISCFLSTQFNCTFNNTNKSPLKMTRIDNQGDTVPPFPSLKFAFSAKIDNDNVFMSMEPQGTAYHTELNAGKDTLSLIVTGVLSGETWYRVMPGEDITSQAAVRLPRNSISFDFFTFPLEREPNGFKDTFHIFRNPVFGDMFNTSDTDYYYLADNSISSIYLKSLDAGAIIGLGITDSTGYDTVDISINAEKSMNLSDRIILPVFIRAFSVFSTGRYELGAK